MRGERISKTAESIRRGRGEKTRADAARESGGRVTATGEGVALHRGRAGRGMHEIDVRK